MSINTAVLSKKKKKKMVKDCLQVIYLFSYVFKLHRSKILKQCMLATPTTLPSPLFPPLPSTPYPIPKEKMVSEFRHSG